MLKTRLINAVFTVAIITGVVVMIFFVLPRLNKLTSSPPTMANTPVVLEQVQGLSQLITVKYVMEKVVILSDVQPLKEFFIPGSGENRVMIVAHGTVLAGIDLKEIKTNDVQISGKKISLKLPPARAPQSMTSLDEKRTQVMEYKTGLLRGFDKDLGQVARLQAVLDINRAARESGIEKEAIDRAKELLKPFLMQMGFSEVEFLNP